MKRSNTWTPGVPRSAATTRANSEPLNPDLAYPIEPVSFVSPLPQRVVVVRDLKVRMPVGLLTADIPLAGMDDVEGACRTPEQLWDRQDVLVDLARLWVSPLGELVAPAIAFNVDGDNHDELNLPLRPLAERSAGDEFLIPAPPTASTLGGVVAASISPGSRGPRYRVPNPRPPHRLSRLCSPTWTRTPHPTAGPRETRRDGRPRRACPC